MSEKSTTQALNLVCTIGKAFLEASALLDSDDLSNPELAQIVERIGQIYGQGESIKSLEQGEDSSTQADNQEASANLSEQDMTAMPQIMISKETQLLRLKRMKSFEALDKFPLGTEIPDTWRDEFGSVYDNPLVVMQYRRQLCDDGKEHFGVELARKHILSHEVFFSTTHNKCYSASEINYWLNDAINGYMDGCTNELCDILSSQPKVQLIIPITNRWTGPALDVCECHAYLPSGANLYSNWGISNKSEAIDGELWACYRDRTPIYYDHFSNTCCCWLRSAYYGNASKVWVAGSDGYPFTDNLKVNPVIQRKCAPICHFILL